MPLTIKGVQEAQQRNNRRINALKPQGVRGEAVKFMTGTTHRYLMQITHVWTGTLRASRRMSINLNQARGRIFTSPAARNPRTGTLAVAYDPIEEARGGSHAAWKRTRDEIGPRVIRSGINIIANGIR